MGYQGGNGGGGGGGGGAPSDPGDQAQAQLQAEGQGQLEGQLQGQGQGQGQFQSSESDNGNWNGNGNGNGNLNGNGNGNLNLDGNGNLNGNGNFNGNANLDANGNFNDNINHTDTCVTVSVDATVSAASQPMLDMSGVSLGDGFAGIYFAMPDFGAQTLNGDGNNFHVDQINSLVNNGYVSDVSNGLSVYGGGGMAGAFDPCDPCAPPSAGGEGSSFNFSQSASATGSSLDGDPAYSTADHSPVSSSLSGATTLTQEAFTQHIVLGSNIQYNSMPTTVVGGDSFSDISAGVTAGHNHH